MTTAGPSEAKQVLLRALESIEEAESELDTEVNHVCVVYTIYRDKEGNVFDSGGWNHSNAPAWLIGAMLRHAANAIEADVRPQTDEDDLAG